MAKVLNHLILHGNINFTQDLLAFQGGERDIFWYISHALKRALAFMNTEQSVKKQIRLKELYEIREKCRLEGKIFDTLAMTDIINQFKLSFMLLQIPKCEDEWTKAISELLDTSYYLYQKCNES